jgi:negative regulator of flagellin synthesis FlgM
LRVLRHQTAGLEEERDMIDGFGRNQPPRLQSLPGTMSNRPTPAAGTLQTAAPAAARSAVGSQSGGSAVQLRDVARSMAAKPPVDAAKVAELRAAMISGRYRVDPEAIAARMIAFDRGSGRN